MSGVLRRGSLNFPPLTNDNNSQRGSQDSNLYGGYRDSEMRTPEISVIALDFRRHSEDLKKNDESVTPSVSKGEKRDLSQDVDSDEISNLLGHVGRWQFTWAMILASFQLQMTLNMFIFVFQTIKKDFWCNTNSTSNVTANSCTVPNSDGTTTQCTDFRFADDGSGTFTIIEEFLLVCDREHYLTLAETCFLVGSAIGGTTSGWISDRYGRKHVLMVFAFIQETLGIALAFSTSLAMYMTIRVIMGFTAVTVSTASFVLVVELVSGKWRTIMGILDIIPMSVAYIISAGIAYYIRDWRTLQLVISVPWVAILFIWYCVPESPRWLLIHGRLDELCAILERAAKFDGRQLPASYRKTLEAAVINQKKDENTVELAQPAGQSATNETPDNTSNTLSLKPKKTRDPIVLAFSRKYLRTTLLTSITWFSLIIIYFGLTLHLGNLGGDIYMNTAIVGGAELITIIASIFIVMKLGTRLSVIIFMAIPGICCLLTNVIPQGDDFTYGVIVLGMIAKCITGADNTIIPTYTATQYPTEIRNVAVGLGNMAAGIGLIMVPFVWLLEDISPLLPLNIMGAFGIIGAFGVWLMKDK